MLRGNLHLEIVMGGRSNPDEGDLESRTKSVVEAFFRGAGIVTSAKREFEALPDMELAEKVDRLSDFGRPSGLNNYHILARLYSGS